MWNPSLVTSHVLLGLGKYPKDGPSLVSVSHHSRRSDTLPAAAASSAYQIKLCYAVPGVPIKLMRGTVARAYMGMASGSPCVVLSSESRRSPSTKRSVGSLYVLIRIVASAGQVLLILSLWRAVWRLSELNAFLASTKSIASLLSDSKDVLAACIAASIPEICPPQSWIQPEASWMSALTMDRTALAIILRAVSPMPSWMSALTMDRTALAIILRAVSPMPIGRTPGFFFRIQGNESALRLQRPGRLASGLRM